MKLKYILFGLVALAVLAGSAALFLYLTAPAIPKDIQKKAAFTIYYPDASVGQWELEQKATKYNDKTGVITVVARQGNATVTVNQQGTPDAFNDVPGYYQKLLDKLNQYQEFDSRLGTITLTRPAELKGGQTAVMNSKGTLLFAQPSRDLTDAEWKSFFDGFVLSR